MRNALLSCSALLAAASTVCATLAAAAAVQVEFVKPESFTDAGPARPRSAEAEVLEPLRDHLVRRAAPRLHEGQTLHVWVTDVDLAGELEPQQPYYREVRILKDIYPPRIELRFRLLDAGGTVLKEGERTLRDPSFLLRGSGDSGDPLRFEKSMIDRWLLGEFGR
jgi:hypothetical protein